MNSPAKTLPLTSIEAPRMGEPYLLTPGPLTTSFGVKEAMLRDWGSRDGEFIAMTAEMRERILAIAGLGAPEFDCVPMQGSGTFAVESMLGTFLPGDGKALVLANGAYGLRIGKILERIGRSFTLIDKGDYLPPRGSEVSAALSADPTITHVVAVHCETSSGILNPIEEIAQATEAAGCKLFIDAMSAFGAIPLDIEKVKFAALAASSNKCIEGVPGIGFVITTKSELEAAKGQCHSLSLDAHDQWVGLEKNGQWRFTPPTHVLAAFVEALRRHAAEGGVAARGGRYQRNCDILVGGMRELGFETLLNERWLSPIIITFFYPAHPNFDFDRFYDLIRERGIVIYPGKLTVADSFRIGCIGQLGEDVMRQVVEASAAALKDMGVDNASPSGEALEERQKLTT
ncbi:MAG: 2-aminoethylphosphonate--pyruvate transaminase [Rhizobiaceae bacterium]